MQNRYTADVGDFGKYGLLRTLTGTHPTDDQPLLTLGIAWYLTPDLSHNADGRHTTYLSPSATNHRLYKACDPTLYAAMGHILQSGNRSVAAVQNAGIFDPRTTIYFPQLLDYPAIAAPNHLITAERSARRQHWLSKAVHALRSRDIIFLDPDNGLEPNIQPGHRDAHHHAFFDDLKAFRTHTQATLVVYHHLGRQAPAPVQVRLKLTQTAQAMNEKPIATLYRRGSLRAFIILPSPNHRDTVLQRLHQMAKGPWSTHFTFHRP